jgi:hypothetical protein
LSYNASVLKIYNATSSLVRFQNKNTFLHFFKNVPSYYNAGVVVVDLKVVGLGPGKVSDKSIPDFYLLFVEMEASEVPVSFEADSSDGAMRMLAMDTAAGIEATKLYLYVNKTNTVFVVRGLFPDPGAFLKQKCFIPL